MKFKNSTHIRAVINGAKFKINAFIKKSESIDSELARMEDTLKRIKNTVPAVTNNIAGNITAGLDISINPPCARLFKRRIIPYD